MFHGKEPHIGSCGEEERVRKVRRRNLCNIWGWLFHRFTLNLAHMLFLSLLLRNASFWVRKVAPLVTCLSCTTHLVHAIIPVLRRILGVIGQPGYLN